MLFLGTAVNAATVAAGGILGSLAGSRLPPRLSPAAFRAIGLFTLVMGVSMALETGSFLVLAISCIAGSIAGEAMGLDALLLALGERIRNRAGLSSATFARGMTTSFLLFCMGSMTVVGSLEEGLGGSSELLLAKAVMDGFAALMLASALGFGVVLSIVPLVLYQGGLTLAASIFGASIPAGPVSEMSAAGGVILVGLGIDILGIRKIEVANMLPALPLALAAGFIAG